MTAGVSFPSLVLSKGRLFSARTCVFTMLKFLTWSLIMFSFVGVRYYDDHNDEDDDDCPLAVCSLFNARTDIFTIFTRKVSIYKKTFFYGFSIEGGGILP